MLTRTQMPEDNAELAKVQVSFARLDPDSAAACPVPLEDLLAYLDLEVPDGDQLTAADLQFVRTARVAERDYWLWRFTQPGPDGEEAYATACLDDGEVSLGYETDYYGLTPEQYLLGEYHDVF